MANFDIVKLVSEALETHLTARLGVIPGAPVARLHHLQPPPGNSPPVLTIFLYDLCEDATMRNRPAIMAMQPDGRYEAERAPLPLVLRYMMTPWAEDPRDAQLMLGCAAQALYDSRSFLGPALLPMLGDDVELLSVNLVQLTLEEKAKVWWAIQQPYHVSLNYDLRVVEISPLPPAAPAGRRVEDRTHRFLIPIGTDR